MMLLEIHITLTLDALPQNIVLVLEILIIEALPQCTILVLKMCIILLALAQSIALMMAMPQI